MKKTKKRLKAKIFKIFDVEGTIEKQFNELISKENFTPIDASEPEDIFIASYPKSGVTWMQNLITCMLLSSDSESITPKLVSEIVPDVHARNFYKRLFPRMFFKTHKLPQPRYKRVIHLVRDGRDVLVSFYHYLQLNGKNGPSWAEMIELKKDIWPQKWHEHTKAWNKNPYNCDLLTIQYEDLKENPTVTLKRIAEFSNILINEEKLNKIMEMNKIENLRDKVVKHGWDYDKNFGDKSKDFFRKGKSGEYKKELSPDLLKKFEKYSEEMLLKYNYEL